MIEYRDGPGFHTLDLVRISATGRVGMVWASRWHPDHGWIYTIVHDDTKGTRTTISTAGLADLPSRTRRFAEPKS